MDAERAAPIVFLAFANEQDDRQRYLRKLPDETRLLRRILEDAEARGLCRLQVRTNATLPDILDVFRTYRDQVVLFHFGGHADSYGMLLEDDSGESRTVNAGGFAAFLAQRTGLQLVFLNACSTASHVEALQVAGVPAVVATSQAVEDAVATRFAQELYTSLASGAPLAKAFAEAAAAVNASQGGPSRHLRPGEPAEPSSASRQTNWRLYTRPHAEDVLEWTLQAAADDPLFGLPPLPARDLPRTPYRHLEWFRPEDAEIFFGRGTEIAKLYRAVTAEAGAPIVLFYGQSGVGKSSVLAAGLLPRLESTHHIAFRRRNWPGGLHGALADALRVADPDSVATSWRDLETRTGKPVLAVLDQVEELFTRPAPELPAELEDFLTVVQRLFADPDTRPEGKLLLSFRKEWLAEIEKRLEERELPYTRLLLERLDRAGIVEAITGPSRTTRLRQQYGLTVARDLPRIIADALLADRGSPVAPMLQILLGGMWTAAKARDHAQPTFDEAIYDELRAGGLGLDDFLTRQLGLLRHQAEASVDSGLALDVLAYHTTSRSTAEQRSMVDLETSYAHQQGVLPALVQACQDLYLVADPSGRSPDQPRASRLAHDTLAPHVRKRFEESDAPGQRARRIVESRAVDWANGEAGNPLDDADLALVEAGELGMRAWRPDERRMVEASRDDRAARERERAEARAERERERQARERTRRYILWGSLGAAAVLLIVAGIAIWFAIESSDRLIETERLRLVSIAQGLAAEAPREQQANKQDELGALLARQASILNERSKGHVWSQVDGALRTVLSAPFFSTILRVPGALGVSASAVAFGADNTVLAVGDSHGGVWVWYLDRPAEPPVQLGGTSPGSSVVSVAFSPNDRLKLAAGSSDGTVRLWDLRQPKVDPKTLPRPVTPRPTNAAEAAALSRIQFGISSSSLAFSADGEAVAIGGAGGLWLWDHQQPDPRPTVVRGALSRYAYLPVALIPSVDITAADAQDSGSVRLTDLRQPSADPFDLDRSVRKEIVALALSADSQQVAAGFSDGMVLRWDRGGPDLDPSVQRVQGTMLRTLAFSPDGHGLAGGSIDGTVWLWRPGLATDQPVVLRGHSGEVLAVAFSPDGQTLTSAGKDGTVRLWDLHRPAAEPVRLRGPHGAEVLTVAFSANGALAAGTGYGDNIWLWRDASRSPTPSTLQGMTTGLHGSSPISTLAFGPDGTALVEGSERGGQVWLWSDLTQTAPTTVAPYRPDVFALSLAYNGSSPLAVSVEDDGSLQVWDLRQPGITPGTLRWPADQRPNRDAYLSLRVAPDGKTVAAITKSLGILVWDLTKPGEAPTVLATTTSADVPDHLLAFSGDGSTLATSGSGGRIRLWRTRQPNAEPIDVGTVRSDLGDTTSSVRSAGFRTLMLSPDGERLAAVAIDGRLRLWDLRRNGDESADLRGPDGTELLSLAFSPDAQVLAAGGRNGTVLLWIASTERLADMVCQTVRRNLSKAEWDRFVSPSLPYEKTCQDLPLGEGVTTDGVASAR